MSAVGIAIPGHASDQPGHAAPTGGAGDNQADADHCRQCEKQLVYAESQKHFQHQQTADGNLHLSFQGDRVPATLHRQAGFFPRLRASLDLDPPQEREVRVKLAASGVCRSDHHLITGATQHPLPVVEGIDLLDADQPETVKVFHAGTAERDGKVVTSGGRVLCVTALGDNIAAAQQACYAAADRISWDGMTLRRDIGWRAIARYSQGD